MIDFGGKVYMLDSFIQYRPLWLANTSADEGHYVSCVGLSPYGDVWKLANDSSEQLCTWGQIPEAPGYIFFYSE